MVNDVMADSSGEVLRRNTENSGRSQASSTSSVASKDRECVNGGKSITSCRINGTILTTGTEDKSKSTDKLEAQSQRQNVIALLVIFISSLLVMVLLFYNFPELDE